jgi:hypothetical protein
LAISTATIAGLSRATTFFFIWFQRTNTAINATLSAVVTVDTTFQGFMELALTITGATVVSRFCWAASSIHTREE